MSNVHLELPGSDRAVLRSLVEAVELQIASLSKDPALEASRASITQLSARWAELVSQLSLGQAAELRACPRCKRLGMQAATRCGYCWMELDQIAEASRSG